MALAVTAATRDVTNAHGTATPTPLVLAAAVGAGDLVMFFVTNNKAGSYQSISTITSSPALTWTREWIFENDQVGGSIKCNMELWTAENTGSGISAGGLTITPTFGSATDAICYAAWSVSGQGSTYTDPNVSLPANTVNTSGGAGTHVSVGGVSTTNTDTIIFGFFGDGTPGFPSPDTGWTGLVGYDNAAGSDFGSIFAEYKIFSTAQSGITVDTTGSNQTLWQFVAYAIQGAAANITGTFAPTEGSDVGTFAGSNGSGTTGTFVSTEASDVANFTGPPLSGVLAAIEGSDFVPPLTQFNIDITHRKRRIIIIS